MSGLRRFTLHPDRPRGEHERARELAATGISEVLRPEDASRLAAHLDGCRDCCEAAIDYALQGERVRGLAEIEPPRELAPALSARLDMEEARVADERARLVRRRATSQAHPLPRRAFGPPALVPAAVGGAFGRPTPFAATAAAGVGLAFVAAIALVASGIPGLFAPPAPTPFAIDPSAVAWVTREADGSYVVQSARFDRVCPGQPVACTGFGARPMTLMTLDVQPASVIIARGGRDAIVVGAGAVGRGSTGGSVYAVRLPTPIPGGSDGAAPGTESLVSASARVSASAPASASALASASASALVSAAPGRATSTAEPVARTAAPSSTEPLVIAGRPAATASAVATIAPVVATIPVALASLSGATPGPTAASRLAILEDVVLVGGRAAYSDDGRWFGFSARPADGSTGPDVYVWHVGDTVARAITSDHASVFSAWAGDRVLASAPDAAAADAAAADAVPTAPPPKKPKATKNPTPVRTPALDDTAPAAAAAATDADRAASGAAATAGSTGSTTPTGSVAPTGSAAPHPDQPAEPATRPVSFLLDPRTGERRDIPLPGLWLPNVDPTGRLLVGWVGTVAQDADSGEWRPATGTLATGSWAGVLGTEDATDAQSEATAAPGRARASAIPTPQRSPDPADATQPAESVSAAGSASGSATATAAARSKAGVATTPAPSPRASGPSGLQAPGSTPSADASPLPSGLRRLRVQPSGRAMPLDWQVRWDASGTHLAVWFADATTPGVGKLSLVAFDADGVESQRTLLDGAPALAGFAVGPSRLAWATPPDKSGGGSRVRVLVWSGTAVGEAGTQPISGLESLVDAH